MTSTPPKLYSSLTDILEESWVELSNDSSMYGTRSPERTTPQPFPHCDEYLRCLRDAQRESNQSSRVVSLASSRRDTPRDSPKSPPNSPNNELHPDDDLKNIYINYWAGGQLVTNQAVKDTDWLWEWSSRQEQTPPQNWGFERTEKIKRKYSGLSMRQARVGKNSLFSREVLYSLILTNILSMLIGTGLGLWLSKRIVNGGGNILLD